MAARRTPARRAAPTIRTRARTVAVSRQPNGRPTRKPETYPSYFTPNGRAVVPSGLQLQLDPDWREEQALRAQGHRYIAGIDEVGRGCLAGPVVAAAAVLPSGWSPSGLRDSKLLDAPERERLAGEIKRHAVAWAVAEVDAALIDQINILQATLLASTLAVSRLSIRIDALILDSLLLPDLRVRQRVLVDADRLSPSVAAASVIAKVHRDRLMVTLDERFPDYGFASHKGYSCPEHRAAIRERGISPVHRRTFGICNGAKQAESVSIWPEEDG